jgi:hypothetical protein
MTGVMATLGYLREKNKLVEDPRMEKSTDNVHIRGVLMEREMLSVGATDALT